MDIDTAVNDKKPEMAKLRKGIAIVLFYGLFVLALWLGEGIYLCFSKFLIHGEPIDTVLSSMGQDRKLKYILIEGTVFLALAVFGGLIRLKVYMQKKTSLICSLACIVYTVCSFAIPRVGTAPAVRTVGLLGVISFFFCFFSASGIGWWVRDLIYPEGRIKREQQEKEAGAEEKEKKEERARKKALKKKQVF